MIDGRNDQTVSATTETTPSEATPAAHSLFAEARQRLGATPGSREMRAEILVGGLFLVAAVVLGVAVPTGGNLDLGNALLCTFVLALSTNVLFAVGSHFTMPTQIAFVPMLFVIPPELVPLFVAVAMLSGKVMAAALGETAIGRVATTPADCWFSLGPALVLALAGGPAPGDASWLLLLGALGAQFVIEFGASWVRDQLHGGASLREQIDESRWIYLVDSLLTPLGLAVAFAAADRAWIVLTITPFFLLMLIFARERTERLESLLELSSAYRGTAYVLGDMVGHDDAYTGIHSQGVVELALDVADRVGLDAKARRNVEFGALLHDVGKVAIPNELINKPGPLNESEWTLVRTHTIEGQRILQKIGGLMSSIGTVVRSSHERYDGGGYPDGLAGESIPIESRIIGCCDAFSAMTTDRPYRDAMSIEEAIAELEDNSGTQFDPAIVELLVDSVRGRYGLR